MRMVLLGANGRLGRVIAEQLRQDDAIELLACARGQSRDVSLFRFDPFSDAWSTLGKADVLINAIGTIEDDRRKLHEIHIGLAEKIISNDAQLGRPHIIQVSALGADAESTVPFLSTKGKADNMLLALGRTLVLRPSIIAMPGTVMVDKIRMLRQIAGIFGNFILLPRSLAQVRIQPVLAGDIGELIHRLCNEPELITPEILPVTGPEALGLETLIELAARQVGRHIRTFYLPGRIGDWLVGKFLAEIFPSLISTQQYALLKTDNTAGNTAFRKLLRYEPHSTLPFWKAALR